MIPPQDASGRAGILLEEELGGWVTLPEGKVVVGKRRRKRPRTAAEAAAAAVARAAPTDGTAAPPRGQGGEAEHDGAALWRGKPGSLFRLRLSRRHFCMRPAATSNRQLAAGQLNCSHETRTIR